MMLFDVAQWMSPCRMGEAVPSMNCEHVVLVCAIIAVHSRHLKRPAPLSIQPFASVIVTVYNPVSATVMDCVMAPLLQRYVYGETALDTLAVNVIGDTP